MAKKKLTGKSVQAWFRKHIRIEGEGYYRLDGDQAEVVAEDARNLLVTARAGSGKTRVIVAKVIYLIAHEKVSPDEIIVFAFNRKARAEVNSRLDKILYNGKPLLDDISMIATTFHAFAYRILGYPEEMITTDYPPLLEKSFAQMITEASVHMPVGMPQKYIFVDEYQDFSQLFLILMRSLRDVCPEAKMMVVGDDWQAINRFAGSDLKFFKDFENYFPEGVRKYYLLRNYRSGRRIVRSANYFMSTWLNDQRGGRAKTSIKSKIYTVNVSNCQLARSPKSMPEGLAKYYLIVSRLIRMHRGQEIRILHRNNCMSFPGCTVEHFCQTILMRLIERGEITEEEAMLVSYSTVHRSKGLEADVVILLELDDEIFPGRRGQKSDELLADEARLFYVAMTRARRELFLLSKDPEKSMFVNTMNPEWIDKIYG